MSNPLARLTGVPKVVVEPEPAPPEAKPARRRSKDEEETAAVEPVKPTTDGKAEQQARLLQEADSLIQLARDVEGVHLPVPERGQTKPEGTVAERWVKTWEARLADPRWIEALHLPPGTVGFGHLRKSSDPGYRDIVVAIMLPVGGSVNANHLRSAVAKHFQAEYEVHRHAQRGADGQLVLLLIRRRADNVTEGFPSSVRRFHLDADHARARTFHAANLTQVTKTGSGERRTAPKVKEIRTGSRGVEIIVEPLSGQSIDDFVRAQGKLATEFKAPNLAVVREGHLARIELRTRELTFPKDTSLSPNHLVRPRTEAERIVAGRQIVLPVGTTADGESIFIELAKRPHTVISGTSGAGKSTLLKLMVAALGLQGAKILLGDFKAGEDMDELYRNRVPGVVHLSTNPASIARLIRWFADELARRQALMPFFLAAGVEPPWEIIVVAIDEWGQGLDELMNSGSKADQMAANEMVNLVSKMFAQGRSFGMFLIVSLQHVYASSLPGRITANAANRIIVGRPKSGSAGHIERLFAEADRDDARAAAEGITDGMQGRGIIAGQEGKPVQFQAFYNTGGAAERFNSALAGTPRQRRFAWQFPTEGDGSEGDWLAWSLWAGERNKPLRTVAELPVIVLDDEDGNPIEETRMYDPNDPLYDPGAPLLNAGHINPQRST